MSSLYGHIKSIRPRHAWLLGAEKKKSLKVSHWGIVGSCGIWIGCKRRAVNFCGVIGKNTRKQMEEVFQFWWNGTYNTSLVSIFRLSEAKSKPEWKLCARLRATFREPRTPVIYPRETSWLWGFWAQSWKYFLLSSSSSSSSSHLPLLSSSVLLHQSLILLTSTTCPGRLLENSGIHFCLFNNSTDIKKNAELCQVGASSSSTAEEAKVSEGATSRSPPLI